jgi:hypothetical protein
MVAQQHLHVNVLGSTAKYTELTTQITASTILLYAAQLTHLFSLAEFNLPRPTLLCMQQWQL